MGHMEEREYRGGLERPKLAETRKEMENLRKYNPDCERVFARIDLDAILENLRNMKAGLAENTQMMAVIKTDGYGHGSVPIAKCLEGEDFIYGYAVATAEEAGVLRRAGLRKPVLILGYTFPESYEFLAREEIRPAVFRLDSLPELARASRTSGKKIKVHIKVDTGMGRIGITPDGEGLSFVREILKYVKSGDMELEGIFTHFARADETDKENARGQWKCFSDFVCRIEKETGVRIPLCHCSNSAGILELPEANMDMVRAGITLYGLMPSDQVPQGTTYLKPALSLHSHIVYIKTIHSGQSVSYGGTFTADSDRRVATIPVGYGDGYPRSLSGGKGYVLLHGKKAPILGRVCMDQFMADVSEIPEAEMGDEIVLLGADGDEKITAEMLGDFSGRFNYELVCDLNRRVPRVYYRGGKAIAIQDLQGYRDL